MNGYSGGSGNKSGGGLLFVMLGLLVAGIVFGGGSAIFGGGRIDESGADDAIMGDKESLIRQESDVHNDSSQDTTVVDDQAKSKLLKYKDVPKYNGEDKILEVNKNQPTFTEDQLNSVSTGFFKRFAEVDKYGRAGKVDIMLIQNAIPDKVISRDLTKVIPSGFNEESVNIKDEGKDLFVKMPLLAPTMIDIVPTQQTTLTATNWLANKGMEEFNKKIVDFLKNAKDTTYAVRITINPIYKGKEKVARGVQYMAQSTDAQAKVKFNVFLYNVEDNFDIDYVDGNAKRN